MTKAAQFAKAASQRPMFNVGEGESKMTVAYVADDGKLHLMPVHLQGAAIRDLCNWIVETFFEAES